MRPFQNRGDRVPSIGELRRVKGTRGTASGRASEVEGGRDVGPDGCSGLPRIVQIEGDLLEPPQTAHEDIDLALHVRLASRVGFDRSGFRLITRLDLGAADADPMPRTPKTPRTRARLVQNAISPRRRRWAANPSASTCFTRAASGASIARRGRGRTTVFSPPEGKKMPNRYLDHWEITHIDSIGPPGPDLDGRLSPPGHQALESVTAKPTATATATESTEKPPVRMLPADVRGSARCSRVGLDPAGSSCSSGTPSDVSDYAFSP